MERKTIIARHGYYVDDRSGHLSQGGEGQARLLAPQVRNFLGELCVTGNTEVITSLAPRAREYGDIIASELKIYAMSHIALGNEDGKAYLGSWIIDQLKPILASYPSLILVTHADQTAYLPEELGRFYKTKWGRQNSLLKGCAYALDTMTPQEIKILRV